MTTLFHDVHQKMDNEQKKHRVPGADFDEVTYADDTICIPRCMKTRHQFVETTENEGCTYGMKLNKTKCELLTNSGNARIIFPDGTPIKKTATNLGCQIGIKITSREEISKRFAARMATMKKLDILETLGLPNAYQSLHCRCSTKNKTTIRNGICTADTISIKENRNLPIKSTEKNIKMDTTYINRVNTNISVYNKINTLMEREGKRKRVISSVDSYNKLKRKRAIQIINQEDTSIYNVSFENGKLRKWIHPKRRVGRPRANWAEETINEIWNIIKRTNERFRYQDFNEDSEEMKQLIKEHDVTQN